MVGSHADEVEGDEAVVRSLCEAMTEAVHAELRRYRAAQERELAALSATQSPRKRQSSGRASCSGCWRSR